jgi:two-component system, NarL family, invasion response regulator UvrY
MKVLIVDDHPIVRAGLRRLIGMRADIGFAEAASANEALASYKKDRPDLVIMDLNLPGASGLEAIRQLLGEDKLARILVFSVHSDTVHAARALEAGALGLRDKERSARPDFVSHCVRCNGRELYRARNRPGTCLAHDPHPSPILFAASLQ